MAKFRYDCELKDGAAVALDCADVFDFDRVTGALRSLTILYDTQPMRESVGSQYS